MKSSEKDRLAAQVESLWVDFQTALSDKRKYAELTKSDPLIHRKVVVWPTPA